MQDTFKSRKAPRLSFEYFPPATPEAAERLWGTVGQLDKLSPQFVSVTYGAGGTTQARTIGTLQTMTERVHCAVAGHLTCVGATRAQTLDVARQYADMGVKRVVALRGDAPKGQDHFTPHPEGFQNSVELIAGLKDFGDFDISVGAYPEKHPDAATLPDDIENLKAKLGAGAARGITQFFFENDAYFSFLDKCAAAGISQPIVPGILPVEKFQGMVRFAQRCETTVPAWMHEAFSKVETPEDHRKLATEICVRQCEQLLAGGVEHLHFYTLNLSDLTIDVCHGLGLDAATMAKTA